MMTFIIALHVLICFLLIVIILIQAGRGGGLVESFSGVESMFGPKTNAFLTRSTAVLSVLFFITCLSLALLSAQQSRSLMKNVKPSGEETAAQVMPSPEQPLTESEAAQAPAAAQALEEKPAVEQGQPEREAEIPEGKGAPKTE